MREREGDVRCLGLCENNFQTRGLPDPLSGNANASSLYQMQGGAALPIHYRHALEKTKELFLVP